MRPLIDTIFSPVLNWLTAMITTLSKASVPASRPVDVSQYLGPFALLGPFWVTFMTTAATLGFIFGICFLVVAYQGAFIKFKNTIKWW